MPLGITWVLSAVFVVLCSSSGYAQVNPPPQSDPTHALPDTIVRDSSAITTSGTSILERNSIEMLPHADGNITGLLRVLPGIQYGESEHSSLTGGEILPAEISISGGRVYENNFLLDGLGNNSLLNPTENLPNGVSNIMGHSQELFIDSSLLESITVHRSNVPARYSGFSGGVVEMQTRNPATEFRGKLTYKTTRSEWTSFHVEREDLEGFNNSDTPSRQPDFRKHYSNVSLDIPMGEKMGILLAYSQAYSKIPLLLLGTTENQYRKSENLLIKYLFQPASKTEVSATFLWNPYEGQYFLRDTRNSKYTLEGGGISFNTSLKRQFNWGELESILGWRESENNRRAPGDYYTWSNSVEATDWGVGYNKRYSFEGGYGDVDTTQESYTFSNHLSFEPFEFFGIKNSIASGLSWERSVAEYKRYADMNSTIWAPSENVVCDENDPFCIPGQQVALRNIISEQDRTSAEVSFIDLYVEDSITLGRVTVRPGLHVGYNDLMKNTDYAARSLILYDVFADGATVLSAGANRYYGKTFLTYALYEERKKRQTYTRSVGEDGTPSAWENETRTARGEHFTQLDIPYVDEWSVGLEQDLFGGILTVAYIERNGEDQFARSIIDTEDDKFYELNNNGESEHKELTASWERHWLNHYLHLNVTWQDSYSSNEDYNTTLEEDDLNEEVCHDGKIVSKLSLPRSDYNREWRANLVYTVKLPQGFSFTNVTSFRSGYAGIDRTSERCFLDESLFVYKKTSHPSSTTFDWKLTWEYDLAHAGKIALNAEVFNVFNRKLYTGSSGEYEMGRQLWVGLDYTF